MSDIVALQHTLYNSRNPTRRWLHTSRRDTVLSLIEQAPLQSFRRAMEVGPGSGVYLPALCERFEAVTATDVEQAHIDALGGVAARHANLTLVRGDLTLLAFGEGFDLVLCSEVLEHVPDPARFIAALARAVRPGGILVLSTPQPWSTVELISRLALSRPMIGLTRRIYREPVLPTGHISVTDRGSVLRMLRSSGFSICASSYFGLYLPGVAEVGGTRAVGWLRRLEALVQRFGPEQLLWTQLHLARREK
jgi:2-polyprenyl-3-methyl-5-hydroxy-6-metoxy-1,4-benzoquinol methylase